MTLNTEEVSVQQVDNNATAKQNKDYAISVIRLISLVLIVSCHMLQYFGNSLAWNLNIGVQLFLIISGFLYGLKFNNWIIEKTWKCIKKIIFDYFILIFLAIILNLLFDIDNLSWGFVIDALFFRVVSGLEHLWYIPLILFCYLQIPFIAFFKQKISNKKLKVLYKIIYLCVIFGIVKFIFVGFSAEWVLCFNVAYLFAENIKNRKNLLILTIVFACVVTVLHTLRLVGGANLSWLFVDGVKNKLRVVTALTLFFCLYYFIGFIKFKNTNKFLDFSDKYSYDLYLTHQIFILGSLSLMSVTKFYFVNIILVLIAISTLTVVLVLTKHLLVFVFKKITNKKKL